MRPFVVILLLIVATATVGGLFTRRASHRETEARARDLTGGDPARGRIAARALGCVACHTIPHVSGPRSAVGPALARFAERPFIAGTVENTPAHLMQFIRDPRSVAPRTAMPNLSVSATDARDLAVFLYTLR